MLGFLVGVAALGVLGTLELMLSPGLEVASLRGWLVTPLLILAEGLFWGLLGGAMFVLPPAFLVFTVLATRRRAREPGPRSALLARPLVGRISIDIIRAQLDWSRHGVHAMPRRQSALLLPRVESRGEAPPP